MSRDVYQQSLCYHKSLPKGKLSVVATKPLSNPRDLALAYSPGVAQPCIEIKDDPLMSFEYTSRGNLVAVISNGTAVLGLGNIGALASKPVMEGKAVLFKKFAGLDAFDIEINETDPDKLIDIIVSLEPTFGGINLEDIKAPECFYIEQEVKKRLKIPVFHDDQHGTAIIAAAGLLNALHLIKKDISKIKLVVSGAGASATSCIEMLISLGVQKDNVIVCDRSGVIYKGRPGDKDAKKLSFAADTNCRTLEDAIKGADVLLGLSSAGVVSKEMVASMAKDPILFTLANPEPEIRPELVNEVRSDAIIATGRSDYPNQINNALCFPYIFRGALDVGAYCINEEMKIACVKAIANLARVESCDIASAAYVNEDLKFGKNYIIPKPFDIRLYTHLSYAVAKAAVDSGVATRPISDWNAYKQSLNDNIYRSGMVMRPIFASAKASPKKMRLVFAEGEDERIIRASQILIDEEIANISLIGRPDVINSRIEKLGLRLNIDDSAKISIIDPSNDSRYKSYWNELHAIMSRKGVTPDIAKEMMRNNNTAIASMLLHMRDADAMICGTLGQYRSHLLTIMNVLGISENQRRCAAVSALAIDNPSLDNKILFITDPYVNIDPSAEQLAEITLMAAEQVRLFGIVPKVALLSYSNFGGSFQPQAKKMSQVLNIVRELDPNLEIEGEMHADAALNEETRNRLFPSSMLKGSANLLVMPNIDAANISLNLIKTLANGYTIGPVLMGIKESAHICTPSANVRNITNLAAIAVAKAKMIKT